ncbi:MAG TPA: 2-phospho-L-lactate guanylyltransferase [Actinomycetota bacterium]|nr:2-phospho-L-lactate guanylyltransferase [Actinomycetota bacterium]
MRVIAVPVTDLSEAKTRLAPILSPLERAALTLAMLEDVLDATTAVPGWDTWVVSPDGSVLEIAARRRVRPVPEEEPTLGGAVRQVEEEVEGAGGEALAVLLADTPLVTAQVLGAALRTLGSVVLAPAADRRGTNLLLRRPPRAIPARFGARSFRRHREEARARDLPVAIVERPELAFDLDVPGDILTLLRAGKPGRARQVCLELGLPERLVVRA